MDEWKKFHDILREAVDGPLRRWSTRRVVDFLLGLKQVYVEIEGGWCGVCSYPSPRSQSFRGLGLDRFSLYPRSILRLIVREKNWLASSLSLATINALTSAWLEETIWPPSIRVLRGDLLGETDLHGSFKLIGDNSDVEFFGFTSSTSENSIDRYDVLVLVGGVVADVPSLFRLVGCRDKRVIGVGACYSFHPLVASRLGFRYIGGVFIDRRICWLVRDAIASGGTLYDVRGVKLVKWIASID